MDCVFGIFIPPISPMLFKNFFQVIGNNGVFYPELTHILTQNGH